MCDGKFCGSPLDNLRHLAAANRMFVREKRINGYTYLYLVETVREGGRAKQRLIKNLGRKEALAASGALASSAWPAPSPATPSGPWSSRNSRPATPSSLP